MPVPAAFSETSIAAAPGAVWNCCTGFVRSIVMPVNSWRGRSGNWVASAVRTRSSSITNCEKITTLCPLPTISVSFSISRLIFPESLSGASIHGSMSGSQHVCLRRVSNARKPNDFSRIADPMSSPSRSKPSEQIRAYSARCTSVSGQIRSISTFCGSSFATSFFVRRRMNGANCVRRRASVPSRSEINADSNADLEPSNPGSKNRKILQRSSCLFSSGVPVSTIRCLARTAKQVCVIFASGFLMNCPSSRMA